MKEHELRCVICDGDMLFEVPPCADGHDDCPELVCTRCGPRFAIQDDIPNMLIDEAELPPGCASLAELECVRAGDAKLEVP